MLTSDKLRQLLKDAGIKPATLYAEGGSILIDDRYLYDVGHGEAEQGGDLHEVASMLPIMAELFVGAVNALPELLEKQEAIGKAKELLLRAYDTTGLGYAPIDSQAAHYYSSNCENARQDIAIALDLLGIAK